MKKKLIIATIAAFAIGMLTCHCLLAAGAPNREPSKNYGGKTNFGNLGLTGTNITGVPAYIELSYPDATGNNQLAYIWVGPTGNLMIASGVIMEANTSFPDVTTWGSDGAVALNETIVGDQTR